MWCKDITGGGSRDQKEDFWRYKQGSGFAKFVGVQ